MNMNTFCVLGAGNGGVAIAGHLAFKGFKVHLYNRSIENIKNVKNTKEISLTGAIEGVGRLEKVSDNIEECMEGAKVLLVVIPATGHRDLIEEMAPFLREDQIIILNPGRTGGALEVYDYLLTNTSLETITVAEAQSLIYACRARADTQAHIYQMKEMVSVATLPGNRSGIVMEALDKAFPGFFIQASSVWETGFNNYGAIFHPGPTLLNMSRIESGESFKYYTEGITEGVSKVLHKLDLERMEIGKALGVKPVSTLEWLYDSYGAQGETIKDCVKKVEAYRGIISPPKLDVRYITEDVPYSLVPMESIGKELGLETGTMTSLIDLANTVFGRDFRKIGRTIDKLGLEGMTAQEMEDFVLHGIKKG
ncbi:MAG: NAD/NADP octopine/nopaline dehydrogenase family protein [Tissierellia bacterium]|nr:NAD/NADP octopine/nopaline dehydrogenase family protein [Tissierellia bacterium]